jgi:diadenosine tetraphosphatase ApaH/serine/threonine PP2A family protein phosphatase
MSIALSRTSIRTIKKNHNTKKRKRNQLLFLKKSKSKYRASRIRVMRKKLLLPEQRDVLLQSEESESIDNNNSEKDDDDNEEDDNDYIHIDEDDDDLLLDTEEKRIDPNELSQNISDNVLYLHLSNSEDENNNQKNHIITSTTDDSTIPDSKGYHDFSELSQGEEEEYDDGDITETETINDENNEIEPVKKQDLSSSAKSKKLISTPSTQNNLKRKSPTPNSSALNPAKSRKITNHSPMTTRSKAALSKILKSTTDDSDTTDTTEPNLQSDNVSNSNTEESNKPKELAKNILKILNNHRKPGEMQIRKLVLAATNIFSKESNIIELTSPIIVVGDIHGQWDDLEKVFAQINLNISNGVRVLFLGDYVDRGLYSIECLARLLALKILHPDYIYLLRGNHEDLDSNEVYGLSTECAVYYSAEVYNTITNHLWSSLPICGVIDSKIFCVHGGIPLISSVIDARKKYEELKTLPRQSLGPSPTRYALAPTTCQQELLHYVNVVQDLLWSDPSQEGSTQKKLFIPSERGMGKIWNEKATQMWNDANGFTHIIRGHQVVTKGIFYSHKKKVITVFSASMYCGGANSASILKIHTSSHFEPITWKITAPSTGLFGKKTSCFY